MAGAFLCPLSCGFVKVATIEIARKVVTGAKKDGETTPKWRARTHKEQFKQFSETFAEMREQNIEYSGFVKKLPALRDKFNKWSSKKLKEKEKFMKTFSLDAWNKLPLARKREHTLANCSSCNIRNSDEFKQRGKFNKTLLMLLQSQPMFCESL